MSVKRLAQEGPGGASYGYCELLEAEVGGDGRYRRIIGLDPAGSDRGPSSVHDPGRRRISNACLRPPHEEGASGMKLGRTWHSSSLEQLPGPAERPVTMLR